MDELAIKIYSLKEDKVELENKIDAFSRNGRCLNDADYFEMISLLYNWCEIKTKIECLQDVLGAIILNKTGL